MSIHDDYAYADAYAYANAKEMSCFWVDEQPFEQC